MLRVYGEFYERIDRHLGLGKQILRKKLRNVSDTYFSPGYGFITVMFRYNWDTQGPSFITFHRRLRIIMRHINEAQLPSDNSVINTYYHIIRLDIGHLRANLKEKKILYLKEIYENKTL